MDESLDTKENLQETVPIDYEKIQEVIEEVVEKSNEVDPEQLEQEELQKEKELLEKEEEKKADAEFKDALLQSISSVSSADGSEMIVAELQELNQQIVVLNEEITSLKTANVEGFWLVTLVVITTVTVKAFFSQITKW